MIELFYPWRKKPLVSAASPSIKAWLRLKRDPLAIASGTLILIATIIAVLGYLITPDKTPMANQQYLELATRKPGTRVQFLKVMRNKPIEKRSWLRVMVSGDPGNYRLIPADTLVWDLKSVALFPPGMREGGVPEFYSLADIVYPLGQVAPSYYSDNDSVSIVLADGSKVNTSQGDLLLAARSQVVTKRFLLGSDLFGRDLLSRLWIGTRVSLSVGFISVIISLVIGILLGALAGYFRGRTDDIILWFINVIWSVPTLLLVIAITFALGRGFWQVFVAVGLTMWVEVARVVRGQFLSIREKEYVEAGRALGFTDSRLIWKHILPNAFSPVIVISAANFASAILIEAGLSFLGIGVQPPMPSWGSMIRENYAYIILDKAYLAILPGLAIMLLVLSFMLLGNALRDALDVRTSTPLS